MSLNCAINCPLYDGAKLVHHNAVSVTLSQYEAPWCRYIQIALVVFLEGTMVERERVEEAEL